MRTEKLYIGGEWIKPKGGDVFSSMNPATERTISFHEKGTEEDVRHAADAAYDAYHKWSSTPAPERGKLLLRFSQLLRQEKQRLGKLVTEEMGKVIAEGLGDVQEAIDITEYMAGEGRRLLGHTTPSELRNKFCMTKRQPIGVVGLITPWNFPIAIPAWKMTAALICGNTVVFKPSSDTPLCAVEFVKLLEKAGLPKGAVNLVTGPGNTVGDEVISNRKIGMVSFTGSRDVGEGISQKAGTKRVGLEMGGKNSIMIMDDADLDLALDGVIWGAFGTTGQRCTATSRLLLHKDIKPKFEKMLVSRVSRLRLGNGLLHKTDVGPLVNRSALEKTRRYVEIGLGEGAKLLTGGTEPKGKGFFYEPTIFTDVEAHMTIAQDEIFGPVLSIIQFNNLDEGIEITNSTPYGLSSSIYTHNINNTFKFMEKAETGVLYVNSSTIGAEVHLPFGGMKGTGNGTREAGIEGINEFSETKSIYVDYSGKLQRAQIDNAD